MQQDGGDLRGRVIAGGDERDIGKAVDLLVPVSSISRNTQGLHSQGEIQEIQGRDTRQRYHLYGRLYAGKIGFFLFFIFAVDRWKG